MIWIIQHRSKDLFIEQIFNHFISRMTTYIDGLVQYCTGDTAVLH